MTRRSLTKSQLATAAGAELLELCQSITADGRLDQSDVEALQRWMDERRDADIPGAEFLRAAVTAILADGRVSDQERRELYRTIESVLPPALRLAAVAARREASETDRAARRLRDAFGPGEWTFVVAGVRHDDRADVARRYLNEGDPVLLSREEFEGANTPGARATAVRIRTTGALVGYVPRSISHEVAAAMDAGFAVEARCVGIEEGDLAPYLTIVARVQRQDRDAAPAQWSLDQSGPAAMAKPDAWDAWNPEPVFRAVGWLLLAAVVAYGCLRCW